MRRVFIFMYFLVSSHVHASVYSNKLRMTLHNLSVEIAFKRHELIRKAQPYIKKTAARADQAIEKVLEKSGKSYLEGKPSFSQATGLYGQAQEKADPFVQPLIQDFYYTYLAQGWQGLAQRLRSLQMPAILTGWAIANKKLI